MEREVLWMSVVDVKYGSMLEGWCSNEAFGSYRVGDLGCGKTLRRGLANGAKVRF